MENCTIVFFDGVRFSDREMRLNYIRIAHFSITMREYAVKRLEQEYGARDI